MKKRQRRSPTREEIINACNAICINGTYYSQVDDKTAKQNLKIKISGRSIKNWRVAYGIKTKEDDFIHSFEDLIEIYEATEIKGSFYYLTLITDKEAAKRMRRGINYARNLRQKNNIIVNSPQTRRLIERISNAS